MRKPKTELLSEIYWSGFYYPGGSKLLRLNDDGCCECTVYSLSNGSETESFGIELTEGMTFPDLKHEIRIRCGCSPDLCIANEVLNPDRYEAVEEAILSGDPFSVSRIMDLISRIRGGGMIIHGGPIGGQRLSDGSYEGVYLLGDGCILRCIDLSDWSDDGSGPIADGAVLCHVFRQADFPSMGKGEVIPYLDYELFSDLEDLIPGNHGIVSECLAHCGSEEYDLFLKALEGDRSSLSLINHRLRLSLGKDRQSNHSSRSGNTANDYQ